MRFVGLAAVAVASLLALGFTRTAFADNSESWRHAFSLPDTSGAEALLNNGHKTTELINGESLLVRAIGKGRQDLFDLLLKHGADPNFKGDGDGTVPLSEAYSVGNVPMAVALIRAGADPLDRLDEVETLLRENPSGAGLVMRAIVDRLHYIPEDFVYDAVRVSDTVLDSLVQSGRPVQLDSISWRDGKRVAVPPWVSIRLRANPRALTKIRKLYARTLPPPHRGADLQYGTDERGWSISRYRMSPVTNDQFLLFGTALCVYFLDADCGSPALVRRARAWSQALEFPCDDLRLAGKLDPDACRVAMYYASVANVEYDHAVLISADNEETRKNGTPFMSRADLRILYAEKHAGSLNESTRASLRDEALASVSRTDVHRQIRVDALRAAALSLDKQRASTSAQIESDLRMFLLASDRFLQQGEAVGATEATKLAIKTDERHDGGLRSYGQLPSRDLDFAGVMRTGEIWRLEPLAWAASHQPTYSNLRRNLIRSLYALDSLYQEQDTEKTVREKNVPLLNMLKQLAAAREYQDEHLPAEWRWRPTLMAGLASSRVGVTSDARQNVDESLRTIRGMTDPQAKKLALQEAIDLLSDAKYDGTVIQAATQELAPLTR